jgi:hypothetical protein
MNLMQANRQWSTRPADERFTSLLDLDRKMRAIRDNSRATTVSTRRIEVAPSSLDPRGGIAIHSDAGISTPTNWSFNQLSALAGAPVSWMKKLPAPMVADSLNYGLRFLRDAADVGLLATMSEVPTIDGDLDLGGDPVQFSELRAATGPGYGRIWNSQLTSALVDRFGDGLTGDFRVPGEFGKEINVTKANTTIYGSDRNVFVFLADEKNRVEMANRRDGKPGSLARGFFVWNSEVGSDTMGAAFFLFDYACSNRIVWGAQQYKEIRLRHTRHAPDRWIEEIAPVLDAYAHESAGPVEQTIALAQAAKLDDDLDAFLKKRFTGTSAFTANDVRAISDAHVREEGRPIETLWDLTTGITAMAKTIPNSDDRVAVERKAGRVLDMVAA